MNKQEFHDMYCISEEMTDRLDRMVEHERQQAIAEHKIINEYKIIKNDINYVQFVEKYADGTEEEVKEWANDLESLIKHYSAKAIADHEAKQWREYPKEKPKNGYYWVTYKDGRVDDIIYENEAFGFYDNRVIAFMKFSKPAPYQPKEGGEE